MEGPTSSKKHTSDWRLHKKMATSGMTPHQLRGLDLEIHGLGLVIVAIGKKLVVVLVCVVETVLASSTRIG
nr:hypothetical protein [Tanacetum cinerariifolium]